MTQIGHFKELRPIVKIKGCIGVFQIKSTDKLSEAPGKLSFIVIAGCNSELLLESPGKIGRITETHFQCYLCNISGMLPD